MPTPTTDEQLMMGVRADQPQALDRLYNRHSAGAQRVARSICRDRQRAEDVVQDAFFSIWRGREGYRPTGSFKGWLMQTVRNRALDSLRRDSAQKRPPAARHESVARDPSSPSALESAIAHGESDALRASLEQLPDVQAEIITLAFFGGLTHDEISVQLELPMGTVKGRMRLGLEKMRREVEHSPEFPERTPRSRVRTTRGDC